MQKLVLGLVMAMSVAAAAQSAKPAAKSLSKPAPPSQQAIEAYIIQCEREWAESVANGDATVIERILADDFIGVDPEGTMYDKARMVADTRTAPKYFASNRLNAVKVRFFGADTAVAQGSESWERKVGTPRYGKFVWTDTWIRRNGKWQIVAAEDLTVADTERAALPRLRFTGTEAYTAQNQAFVRYRLDVENKQDFADELFASAPQLPPCGSNTKAARTWVDIFAADGKRIYGFCALGKADDLQSLWFALPQGTPPPAKVYIELWDRKTDKKMRSEAIAVR